MKNFLKSEDRGREEFELSVNVGREMCGLKLVVRFYCLFTHLIDSLGFPTRKFVPVAMNVMVWPCLTRRSASRPVH